LMRPSSSSTSAAVFLQYLPILFIDSSGWYKSGEKLKTAVAKYALKKKTNSWTNLTSLGQAFKINSIYWTVLIHCIVFQHCKLGNQIRDTQARQ
jgi:hypothetical protein